MQKHIYNMLKNTYNLILPPEGGWVTIKGNPNSPRGNRIIKSHRDEGIKHLDIYWAYDEDFPWSIPEFIKRESANDNEIVYRILYLNGIEKLQLTWMTLHTPSSQLIRMWAGEVALFSESTIQTLLEENCLETISFQGENVVWSEETRDLIGSLMLDGMSKSQAQHELLTARAIKKSEVVKPSWFYRPINWYYENFCEEPEYDVFWKKEETITS